MLITKAALASISHVFMEAWLTNENVSDMVPKAAFRTRTANYKCRAFIYTSEEKAIQIKILIIYFFNIFYIFLDLSVIKCYLRIGF